MKTVVRVIPKNCRHRRRSADGTCLDCHFSRAAIPVSVGVLPSAPLAIQI